VGGIDVDNSFNHCCASADRGIAGLALQPVMGLLPKRRIRAGSRRFARIAISWQVVKLCSARFELESALYYANRLLHLGIQVTQEFFTTQGNTNVESARFSPLRAASIFIACSS
jgi:hypothetical protein